MSVDCCRLHPWVAFTVYSWYIQDTVDSAAVMDASRLPSLLVKASCHQQFDEQLILS